MFAELLLGKKGALGPDRTTIAEWVSEVYQIKLRKLVVMARQAGVLHVQIDPGKRGAKYHFPIKISFCLESRKMPVKFVLADANITRTTGEDQANAVEMALNNAGTPLAIAVTLGGDNTSSITGSCSGAAVLFSKRSGGTTFDGCIAHKDDLWNKEVGNRCESVFGVRIMSIAHVLAKRLQDH